MEEELGQNFDCVAFIEKHLQNQELTDLTFSLQMLCEETEDQIGKASKQIIENKDLIIITSQQLFKELIDFKSLQDDYLEQVAPTLNNENPIYEKISECLNYKNNIQKSLEMFQLVMQLDQLYEFYQKLVDDNNIEAMIENINKNLEIFLILMDLPKMNPRYGQIEKIILLIEQFCHKDLFNSPSYSQKFQILTLLNISQRANLSYLEQRVQIKDFSFLKLEQDASLQDAQQLVHEIIFNTDQELSYLKTLKGFQSLFSEYVKYLIGIFNKNVFKNMFNFETQYNKILEILYTYVTYFNILHDYTEKGYLQQQNFKQILRMAFEPYSNGIKLIVKQESQQLNQKFAIKEQKQLSEKLSEYNFQCQDVLEQSFKRASDLSFQLAYEDWIYEVLRIFDTLLINFNNILNEIPTDPLGQFISSYIKSKQILSNQGLSTKFLMKQNLSLFESLIQKHYEIIQLQQSLIEVGIYQIKIEDNYIKQTLDSSQDDSVTKQISLILCEKLQYSKNKVFNAYSDELSLSSSLREILEESELKLTVQILRLLLSDSITPETDYIHNFRTNLELIEGIYKIIKPQKISFKACVRLGLDYDILEQKSAGNVFSQPTCFWAAMFILLETKIIKIPEMQMFDSQQEGFESGRTLYDNKLYPNPVIDMLPKSPIFNVPRLKLDIPVLRMNQQTIYVGMAYKDTHQIHQILDKNKPKKCREYQGMLAQGLEFDSSFECGNLDRVDKIGLNEYNLYMRIDTNSIGHSNWFYFKVRNTQKTKVKFNICNFTKPQTLYLKGLKPYVLSLKSSIKHFTQQGEYVKYFQSSQNHFTLQFNYDFDYADDEVQFAALPPYSYTKLRKKLRKLVINNNDKLSRLQIAQSLSGLSIPLLIITDYQSTYDKKVIIISARIHPSETCSSFMMDGLLDFLLSNNPSAQFLRKYYVFKIIPMMNPDGVVVGNYRNGLQGMDLNRQFNYDDLSLLPEVKALKQLIDEDGKNMFAYFDFHGHQQRQNIFLYGPPHQDGKNVMYPDVKIIPYILQQKLESFRVRSCQFGIPRYKQSTARAYANQYVQNLCYTFESSFCGYYNQKLIRFTQRDWYKCGSVIGQSIFIYLQIKNQKITRSHFPKQINVFNLQPVYEEPHDSDDEDHEQSDLEQYEDYTLDQLKRLHESFQQVLQKEKIIFPIQIKDPLRITNSFNTMMLGFRKTKIIQPQIEIKYREQRKSIYTNVNVINWDKQQNMTRIQRQIQLRAQTNAKMLLSFRDGRKMTQSLHTSPAMTPDVSRAPIYSYPIKVDDQKQQPLPVVTRNGRFQKIITLM
ncbi:hypothetical protein pb186bvf_000129 [Paramecium bursaria]